MATIGGIPHFQTYPSEISKKPRHPKHGRLDARTPSSVAARHHRVTDCDRFGLRFRDVFGGFWMFLDDFGWKTHVDVSSCIIQNHPNMGFSMPATVATDVTSLVTTGALYCLFRSTKPPRRIPPILGGKKLCGNWPQKVSLGHNWVTKMGGHNGT